MAVSLVAAMGAAATPTLFGAGPDALAAGGVLRPFARVVAQPAMETGPRLFPPRRRSLPLRVPDATALEGAKTAAGRHGKGLPGGPSGPSAPAKAAASAAEPITTVFGGLNQPGLGAIDNSAANQGSPPDTTGAIGPSHYVEFVNSKVAVYSRASLALGSQLDLDAFVGRSGQDVFDPQIQWDQQGGRWLYLADDIDSTGKNFLAFGWSKTADPSDLVGGWCRFVISTDVGGKFLDDYPKIGHDKSRVIFGANVFRRDFFITAHIWTFAKPAVGDTSCSTPALSVFGSSGNPLRTADGNLAFTPVPANTADSSANGYVVAADWPPFGSPTSQIMAWHLSGSPGSPTLVQDGNINVGSYSVPANVPQPGTSNVLDALDARLTQAVARADPAAGSEAVWTQHTVAGPGGRAVVRWYELLPASDSVRQQGSIQDPNHFVFNGAVSPASDGSSAAIFYNIGSNSLLAQIRAKSRSASTALGGMGGELTLGTSSAADQDFSCSAPYGPPCRWGDYAGASPDPVNQNVVWGSNQLNGPFTSDPHWVTRNFAVVAGEGTGYVRPKGATPMLVSLVPAQAPCSAPNRTHGGGLPRPSCSPATQVSPNVTLGTPDLNGAPANGDGSVRLAVCPVPGCAAPDIQIATDLTDLRCRPGVTTCGAANSSGGADYTGQLQTALTLRVTDSYNGPSLGEAATMVDVPFPVTTGCSATATDDARGSTCSLVTTANSLVAGSFATGKRADVEVAQVQVRDGGSDGLVSTAGNSLFAVQGIFIP